MATDFELFAEPVQDGSACGPDCEYEVDFIELAQAVAGKAEQQFGDTIIPAVAPDWREVDRLARALLQRTRDLRVVAWLTLANTNLQGAVAFAAGLELATRLCERFWDDVHPRIVVDGEKDPYLRISALSAFSGSEFSGEDRLLQTLRRSQLLTSPLPLTFRDFEAVFASAPEASVSKAQLKEALDDAAIRSANAQVAAITAAYDTLQSLQALIDERFDTAERPDLERLQSVLKLVAGGIEQLSSVDGHATTDPENETAVTAGEIAAGAFVGGAIRSREDASRALDSVCEYLERFEPSNPASLFARRAQRMLCMPFLDIMRELAPDAVSHVEMVTGATRHPAD